MCFLAVTLLSVIAHLTAGQGWGGSNAGTASRWNGASNSQTANSGFGNVGWGTGAGAAGFGTGVGTQGFGVGGVGTQGFGVGGVGTQGFGVGGVGTQGFGVGGVGAQGFGVGGVGTQGFGVAGVGTQGFGVGGVRTQGFGVGGFGTQGFGVGGVGTQGFGVVGFGTQGFGVGGTGGFGLGKSGGLGWGRTNSFVNPLSNTTMTCTFSNTGITGSVTLRRQQNWGGWGLGLGSRSGLGGSLVVRTSTVSGTYNLVFTERARVEGTKSADNLGPVIGASQWGQSSGWGRGLGNPWRNPWSNAWGVGSSTTTQGIASTVTLSTNQETNVDLAAANLPFRDLEHFAGRGVALCASLTTDTNGRTICADPVLACCKLGFDNQDAVTPAAP